MAIKTLTDKAISFIKKYRYVFLIFMIGIVLMLLPTQKSEQLSQSSTPETVCEPSFEERLSEMLCCVEGAGDVKVILTASEGEQILYQMDVDRSGSGDNGSERTDTVIVSDAQRNETGLIKQIIPAVYKGAIIMCQGADDPSVCYCLVDAVSKLTGLGANSISVLKMK